MVSEGSYQENFHGSQYLAYSRDTPFNLGSQAQVRVGGTGNGRSGEDAASDGQTLTLDAVTRPVAITPGQRIPLNQSLAEWRNTQGDSVKLVPMAGQAKDQVRLCLDQQVQNVKRLSCTLWQVPTDWTTLSALPTYQACAWWMNATTGNGPGSPQPTIRPTRPPPSPPGRAWRRAGWRAGPLCGHGARPHRPELPELVCRTLERPRPGRPAPAP